MRFRHAILPLGVLLLGSELAAADVVTDWNSTAVEVGRRQNLGSNRASRLIAIAQLAAYDAVVSVTRTHEPFLAYLPVSRPVSLEAAVAQAAHDALLSLQPNDAVYIGDRLTQSLDPIPDGPAKANGIDLGHRAALAIVFERLNDGSAVPLPYSPGLTWTAATASAASKWSGLGKWVPTPPSNAAALDPEWRHVTPFGLESANQFRAAAPPALSKEAYADAFNEVKTLGGKTSADRTAEQTQIADFWKQATEIPFNAIARTVAVREGLTLEQNARLFALLNIAIADSRIAIWDTKYAYSSWRPVTAIRFPFHDDNESVPASLTNNTTTTIIEGTPTSDGVTVDDGNPETAPDATWEPYLTTPAHPDYVSGHSGTGAAAAAVLSAIFGDETSFAASSPDAPARSFSSFSAAAEENAVSRLYAGIHFSYANEAGLELGKNVGEWVANNLLAEVEATSGGAGAGGESGDAGSHSGDSGSGGAAPSEGGAGGEPAEGGSTSAPAEGGEAGGGSSGTPSAGRGGASPSGGQSGAPSTPEFEDDACACSAVGAHSGKSALSWLSAFALAGALVARSRRRR